MAAAGVNSGGGRNDEGQESSTHFNFSTVPSFMADFDGVIGRFQPFQDLLNYR